MIVPLQFVAIQFLSQAFYLTVPLDYSRRNWRENVNNPCYRWTFIEAFW